MRRVRDRRVRSRGPPRFRAHSPGGTYQLGQTRKNSLGPAPLTTIPKGHTARNCFNRSATRFTSTSTRHTSAKGGAFTPGPEVERYEQDSIFAFCLQIADGRLSGDEADIVETPVFQRLRGIRQLAMANMVYPGALHTLVPDPQPRQSRTWGCDVHRAKRTPFARSR